MRIRVMSLRLNHLGLPVTDVARSRRFYEDYFAFDPATAQRYEDGTVIIRDATGFDLALHECAAVPEPPPFLHFGFHLEDAEQVRSLLTRLRGDGVRIVEEDDEADMTSFKCLDPDGHRVEVYYEA